jgi:hypothetical protein
MNQRLPGNLFTLTDDAFADWPRSAAGYALAPAAAVTVRASGAFTFLPVTDNFANNRRNYSK